MRKIRLKIILVFLVSSLGIGIYSWINNFKQIDILRTKNDSVTNSLIHQVKNSNDLEFLRENAINNINLNKEKRYEKSELAVFQSKLILTMIALILISLTLGIIQLVKQKTQYHNGYT